jgi:hypothetical protein
MTETVYQRRRSGGGPRSYEPAEPLPDPRTLLLMAQDLMVRLQSCFLSQGVVPPDRSVIFMSPIPADCEQVAVLFAGWSPLPPWDTLTNCDSFRWIANFSVIITRCTPAISTRSGKAAPTPDLMLQAAQIASTDAEVLLCLVSTLGEIGADLNLVTMAPLGGMQTVELTVSLPAAGALE